VLNFGAATSGHRDCGDVLVELCIIATMQKCKGGQLCFYEPGIILESCNGDWSCFQSSSVTHFNLHFQGIRASLVLHSDSMGKAWAENYNCWPAHVN
jgi:hypothetical protein